MRVSKLNNVLAKLLRLNTDQDQKLDGEDVRSHILLLVLASLAEGPKHGYAVMRAIEAKSDGAIGLLEGSVYPVLRALQEEGHVISEWHQDALDRPPRRVYILTPSGHVLHKQCVRKWQYTNQAIGKVVGDEI